jgi:hypothetical protein
MLCGAYISYRVIEVLVETSSLTFLPSLKAHCAYVEVLRYTHVEGVPTLVYSKLIHQQFKLDPEEP